MRQTGRRILLTQRDGERVRSGRFVVTVPQLTALTLSGTGDMTVSGLNADHFDISLSGTGDLDIQGSARRARVQLSGTGDLDGDDFADLDEVAGLFELLGRELPVLDDEPENAELLRVGQRESHDVDPVVGKRSANAAEMAGLVLEKDGELLNFHDGSWEYVSARARECVSVGVGRKCVGA